MQNRYVGDVGDILAVAAGGLRSNGGQASGCAVCPEGDIPMVTHPEGRRAFSPALGPSPLHGYFSIYVLNLSMGELRNDGRTSNPRTRNTRVLCPNMASSRSPGTKGGTNILWGLGRLGWH